MSKLFGKHTDMGDIVVVEKWLVKGRHWTVKFHIGVPKTVPASERLPLPRPRTTSPANSERIDVTMDLQADKKVELAASFTDEVGNSVPTPTDAALVWSNDNDSVITLTDNGDGTATAAATGTLGNAVVSLTATFAGGGVSTGDLLISVVAGDAERVVITPGAVSEVTPDV